MLIFLFSVLCQFKELYFNISSPDNETCNSINGCNLKTINSTIKDNDIIHITNSILSDESAHVFLEWINSTSLTNITLIGNNTLISNPGFEDSEYPAIFIENGSIQIQSIIFSGFRNPILNSNNSLISVKETIFSNSCLSKSALLAFVNSNVSIDNSQLINNTAQSQSHLVGVNCTITLNSLKSTINFIESLYIKASFHFLNCSVMVENGNFSSNTYKLPMFASSNSSSLTVSHSTFEYNGVLCLFALEFDSIVNITSCKFSYNVGTIITGGQTSFASFTSCTIDNQHSEDLLFGITESSINITDSICTNSNIAGFALLNLINKTQNKMKIKNITLTSIKSKVPLFIAVGGNLTFNKCNIENVESEAEIVIISHQNGNFINIKESNFSKLISTNAVSTGISGINCNNSYINHINMFENNICGALFENTTLYLNNSKFIKNQCYPQGNSLPLAIVTSSLSNTSIKNSIFHNNSALTGSVFTMNTTTKLKNIEFASNKAIQGAAIFSANSNIKVKNTNFISNSAMSIGGAISFTYGNANFTNCSFIKNDSPEGSVFSIKNGINITLDKCISKLNKGANATFINAEGLNMKLFVNNSEVDDEFKKAVYVGDFEVANFSSTKFNCKNKCAFGELLKPNLRRNTKKEENKTPTQSKQNIQTKADDDELEFGDEEFETQKSFNILWVALPVTIFILFVIYKILGPRKTRKIFNAIIRSRGRRDNWS